jgi:hypothetical protein
MKVLYLVLTFSALCVNLAAADDGVEFFEKRIRPILSEHCEECHSSNATRLGGSLLLDSRDGVRKGGDSGRVLEPGNADASLLIKVVRYTDDIKMPPKGKLPATAIADLETWVKMGAPDPREKVTSRKAYASWEETLKSRRNWWSLRPVQDPALPNVGDARWSRTAIDRFIAAKLAEATIPATAPADPRTLARRLGLVLTGLPPTPAQLDAFLQQCGGDTAAKIPDAAVESLVDSLLASPQFGERWARHWLDVVRFTETHGNEWNYEVHHAWRYRDYLINALNADVPFDQFVREHIAGDLLPKPRWNEATQTNDSVIGTSFYRFGEVNHDDCISLRELGYDLLDNQIDTLTKAFQATTVACARCHDHKLDAVSMHDYYGLLGILRSSRLVSHSIDAPSVNAEQKARLRELKVAIQKELAELWAIDAARSGHYLQAAQARKAASPDAAELVEGLVPERIEKWVALLSVEKMPLEHPLEPWRQLVALSTENKLVDPAAFQSAWKNLAQRYERDDKVHSDFNAAQFVAWADFREKVPANWQVGGLGLMDGPTPSGEFSVHSEGDLLVRSILPAGSFTNVLSEKLNGTLRSPVLPLGKKYISLQVMGLRSSAVRLVSNNCQLNYKNYKALTSGDLHWETFAPPDDRDSLRTYAELMTMLDNPKFPDQLSALGGDKENYRLPWDKAAANPRSWFGITQVVLHDAGEPPRAELKHLRRLFQGAEPSSLAGVADLYATAIKTAVKAWSEGRATDDDVRWLDVLVRHELLGNRVTQSPRLQALVTEYRRVESDLAAPRIVPGIADSESAFEQPVFVRGDCRRPAEPAKRRFLEVLSETRDGFAGTGSGRLELADRIASPKNPLTARVFVNRVWHHLFGSGLVRTVDDFGHVGDLPSHPELLDHLATQFVRDGWSLKRLTRSIVLTETFRQASRQDSPLARDVDPENRLLWHYPARRMEAEAIRDGILSASGRLDLTMFGPSIQPFRDDENADRRLFPGPLDGHGRRSIYIKNNLMESPRFLSAFNTPGGKVTQGRRDSTNVPAQALALLNDPFVLQQADYWASRLVQHPDQSADERIQSMFQAALGRFPTSEERESFAQAVRQFAELEQVPAREIQANQSVWKDLAHAVLNLKEFIYIP